MAYVAGLTRGYDQAWEVLWPMQADGVAQAHDAIRRKAIDETRERLLPAASRPVVSPRVKSEQEILTKLAEFRTRLERTADKGEKAKLEFYLASLQWVLNANGSRPH